MDLRLTSTAHARPASRASCGESPNSAARLGAEAQALLAGGDIDAYRSLFTSARQLEDPNRCYHAQVVLLERGLAAAASFALGPEGRAAVGGCRRRRGGPRSAAV